MLARAVVLEQPKQVQVRDLQLADVRAEDVVVDVAFSGVSAGTEKLLWTGDMPAFPGMGYPLVPGYEAVGQIVDAGAEARARIGDWVFAPGSTAFVGARGLFGANAQRLHLPQARALSLPTALRAPDKIAQGALFALAATALHALRRAAAPLELIIGHGALGRLLARIAIATGAAPPLVWEINPARHAGAMGYAVCAPETDSRRDYRVICDASGDPALLDPLIGRLARGGELVLAGFYPADLRFAFAPAFMREARLTIAAEFTPADAAAIADLIETGALSLDGLISHQAPASAASDAYRTAFEDPCCLKMVLDWRRAA